jgi:hypothetical protein
MRIHLAPEPRPRGCLVIAGRVLEQGLSPGRPTRDVSERTRATLSDSAALRSHCGVAMILRG